MLCHTCAYRPVYIYEAEKSVRLGTHTYLQIKSYIPIYIYLGEPLLRVTGGHVHLTELPDMSHHQMV